MHVKVLKTSGCITVENRIDCSNAGTMFANFGIIARYNVQPIFAKLISM